MKNSKFLIYLFIIFVLYIIINSSLFFNIKFEEEKIKEVIPGKVYSGMAVIKGGKKVYFGIEVPTEAQLKNWQNYIEKTYRKYINLYLPPNVENVKNKYHSNKKYKSFLEDLSSYCKKVKADKRLKLLEAVSGALCVYDFPKDGSKYYIAYASKVPVVGYFSHPKSSDTLIEYHEGYKNLLMIVRSVDIPNTGVYNNQGIFRTLRNFLEGGYPKLANKLHGFTANYFQKFHRKTHMSVAPMPKMYKILKNSLPAKSIKCEGDIPDELCHFFGLSGNLDTRCVITTQHLIRLYNK